MKSFQRRWWDERIGVIYYFDSIFFSSNSGPACPKWLNPEINIWDRNRPKLGLISSENWDILGQFGFGGMGMSLLKYLVTDFSSKEKKFSFGPKNLIFWRKRTISTDSLFWIFAQTKLFAQNGTLCHVCDILRQINHFFKKLQHLIQLHQSSKKQISFLPLLIYFDFS